MKISENPITIHEVRKASRNRGMPLEALSLDVTPVGLHYMLAHFDIPILDPGLWSLAVQTLEGRRLILSLEDLHQMRRLTEIVTIECAGNGRTFIDPRPVGQPWGVEAVSTSSWTGVPLTHFLEEVGITEPAHSVLFTGADSGVREGRREVYQRALALREAKGPSCLLAFEMNGRPLEPQNGAPLRLVVPGWYGMAHVKWLTEIEAIPEAFDGPQHRAYRYRQSEDDPGEPVTTMRVRALMIPPGIPEDFTRHRHLEAGPVALQGRAWSGSGPIERVEVGVDGTWQVADLASPPASNWAWQRWSWIWHAEPGEHVLSCRATDANGNTQPLEASWNLKGVGNNAAQKIEVTVT